MATDIYEYANQVLSEHGCDCYTYGDKNLPYCQIASIAAELRTAYPDGMEYSYEDVAQAILDISKPRHDSPEISKDQFDFDDWGSWGVGDFYDGPMKSLQEAFLSGKTFDTGWHGYKKEIESVRIQRKEDAIIISCSTSMDEVFDQWDLFSDFLTDEEMNKLTEQMVSEIREYLCMGDFSETVESEESLPRESNLDDVIKKAEEIMQECRNELHEHFKECISTTLYVMYGESEETDKIIMDRCNSIA